MRFGIRGVMLLTLVVGVGMAAAYQFYRANETGDRLHLFIGMLILCAGPMAIWVVANLLIAASRRRAKNGRDQIRRAEPQRNDPS